MLPKLAAKPLKPSILTTDGISQKTHEEHFKLYQGYVNKSNELFEKIAGVSRDPKAANQTYSDIREMKVELSFALGGVKNHELYFDVLGKNDSRPGGELLAEINRSFGSVEKWQADLKATGLAGRGWAWTAYDHDLKRLMNYIGDAQNSYPIWNATPIIGLDVYEHAYYLDFATNRGAYIDAFFANLNWDAVARRFLLAV
jgi:Fe-Mn family superoxide dismutase